MDCIKPASLVKSLKVVKQSSVDVSIGSFLELGKPFISVLEGLPARWLMGLGGRFQPDSKMPLEST